MNYILTSINRRLIISKIKLKYEFIVYLNQNKLDLTF